MIAYILNCLNAQHIATEQFYWSGVVSCTEIRGVAVWDEAGPGATSCTDDAKYKISNPRPIYTNMTLNTIATTTILKHCIYKT